VSSAAIPARSNRSFPLAGNADLPASHQRAAEAIGMMIVKLEAREFLPNVRCQPGVEIVCTTPERLGQPSQLCTVGRITS